jgi:hypothetical protein
MSGKGGKGGSKRKAEDEDEIVVEGGEAAAGKAAKPKKAKAAEKAPPKPKVLKMKPLNADEERVAKGASMERNAAIANFLDGIREAYKAGVSCGVRRALRAPPLGPTLLLTPLLPLPWAPLFNASRAPLQAEYMKAAAAAKAVAAVRAVKEPLRVAQELGALQGCGPSTIQKVYDFLLTYGEAPQGLAAQAAAAQVEAGRDPEFAWVEDSEKEVLLELLKKGEVPWEKVQPWRTDIKEADFKKE